MAIQAQMYPNSSGFPPLGGGAVGMHDHIQQFQTQNPQMQTLIPAAKSVDDAPIASCSSQRLGFLADKQSMEIDQFIHSQNERLRLALREKRKRDVSQMLRKMEERTSVLLRQKDLEIVRAAFRTSQLESIIVKLQNESQTWQQVARENEVHVMNLNNTIQQLHENNHTAMVEDSESCCDENEEVTELEQTQQDSSKLNMFFCEMCRSRNRSVVFLPCRHLCCCTICEPITDFCPVCLTEKRGSIEALFH